MSSRRGSADSFSRARERKGVVRLVEVDRLSKSFGDRLAVTDVSFTLEAGTTLAIVGESGSGKTTIARMLAGLETPTAGRIAVCGDDRSRPARRASERRDRARQLQIVFQDPYSSLDPRQSLSTCLDEVLRLHHPAMDRAARAARVAELASLTGLDGRQQSALPRELSGGQRQRVAIARALAAEPAVMLLDESVSALDVSVQAQILNLLADIRAATGVGYILISHDLAVVRQLSDRSLVLRHGRVVEHGPTSEVLDQPTHPYTRLLRDSVPRPGRRPARPANS
ncbi:ABC transporter ATP-binding protein [Kribbella turkmenica]|uniref:ABC transporter ATP-binding protein n=1 Tax=Kribbella turkmenica TaxID=2530375 RepID=UPI001F2DAB8A|nr:ATP-binding cassette domain-containing protein [Kribbella turkmenica]